jgi:hypothetical protein
MHSPVLSSASLSPIPAVEHSLPNWIFDIDNVDDELLDGGTKKSLMEELEIDPMHIYQ